MQLLLFDFILYFSRGENEDQRMEIPERQSLATYSSLCYLESCSVPPMSFAPQCVKEKKSTCHEYLRRTSVNLIEVYLDDPYYEVFTIILTLPTYSQKKTYHFPPFWKNIRNLTEEQIPKENLKNANMGVLHS